jgi:hypothetical protein
MSRDNPALGKPLQEISAISGRPKKAALFVAAQSFFRIW